MKKNILCTTVGISLLSLGLTTVNISQNTYAAKVTAGKTAKVTHTAYVYNNKGKHVKKASLKKNKTTKVIKIVKIKGKKYAQIGKNQFVKLGNLSGISSKTKKKTTKAKTTKKNYKKIWDQKLKGLDEVSGYKVTALKDTTINLDYCYEWYDEVGSWKGKITFPKGSSVYIASFEEEGKYLAVDAGSRFYIDINDVSLSNWEDADDIYSGGITDLDSLVPQFGEYKKQTYSGINGSEYSLLGMERELTKRGILKDVKYTYTTNTADVTNGAASARLQKVLHESDADYQKDLVTAQDYLHTHY